MTAMTATTTANRTPTAQFSWLPDYLPEGSAAKAPSLLCAWKTGRFHAIIERDATRDWATLEPDRAPRPVLAEHGTFRDLLADARLARGYSQQQLAARAGLSHSQISRLEHNRRLPTRRDVALLCAGLGLNDAETHRLYLIAGHLPPGLDMARLLQLMQQATDDAARAA
jgi:transcriptional regulator with XRE-family HTH domain